MEQTKFLLDESQLPRRWYNIVADMPNPPQSPLHPGTGEPIGPDDLAPLFPMALILQEVSEEAEIPIPEEILDIYSLSHVLHGLIFFFVVWLIFRGRVSVWAGLVLAVLIESGWELYENSNYLINRYRTAGYDYSGDSIVNSVFDIFSMMVGYLIAAVAPAWMSVLLLVGVEVGMGALIRDNLLLNIVNLIHPVDWITKWQDGG